MGQEQTARATRARRDREGPIGRTEIARAREGPGESGIDRRGPEIA